MDGKVSFSAWEKFMDSCAKRLLKEYGDEDDSTPRVSKSNKVSFRILTNKNAIPE